MDRYAIMLGVKTGESHQCVWRGSYPCVQTPTPIFSCIVCLTKYISEATSDEKQTYFTVRLLWKYTVFLILLRSFGCVVILIMCSKIYISRLPVALGSSGSLPIFSARLISSIPAQTVLTGHQLSTSMSNVRVLLASTVYAVNEILQLAAGRASCRHAWRHA